MHFFSNARFFSARHSFATIAFAGLFGMQALAQAVDDSAYQGGFSVSPFTLTPPQTAAASQSEEAAPTPQKNPDIGNFEKGDYTLQVLGSYAVPFTSKHERYESAHLGGGYYFADNWALYANIVGHRVDSNHDGRETFGGEFNLHFRWHFIKNDKWSVFFDAGAGVLYTEDVLPNTPGREGTRFNFTPQGGFGATYELKPDLHLLGSVRYFHVSNAGHHGSDRHYGSDSIMFILGLLFEF